MSFLSFAFADNLLNINDVNMLFARNTVKNCSILLLKSKMKNRTPSIDVEYCLE
jgi:hypothetical protein